MGRGYLLSLRGADSRSYEGAAPELSAEERAFEPATNTATVYHSEGGLDGTFQITFTIAGRSATYTGTLATQGPDGSVYLPLSGTKVG